jgi:succinoglycan biosynthesis protein ExoA
MKLSVVCPVYNEEKHIGPVLAFFVKALPADKELLVIDGGSNDRTRSIVEEWSRRHPNILLLDNPGKYVPFALNKAIPRCHGTIIVRLDAHTEYADDYFEKILDTFSRTDADIVGGPMRAKGITAFQKAVAYCTSTPMGVGDSSFHDETAEGYVDSVYLGAWRKNIFDKTGLFDVQMVRNQDDEFHYRAKSLGHKIYLNPEIRSVYYPRNSLSALVSQYFQYGLYKPLVLRKVSSEMKIRHLVPSVFVLYLLMLPAAVFLAGTMAWIPLWIYLAGCIYFVTNYKAPLNEKLNCFVIYPALHLAYGTGFLSGLFRRNAKN